MEFKLVAARWFYHPVRASNQINNGLLSLKVNPDFPRLLKEGKESVGALLKAEAASIMTHEDIFFCGQEYLDLLFRRVEVRHRAQGAAGGGAGSGETVVHDRGAAGDDPTGGGSGASSADGGEQTPSSTDHQEEETQARWFAKLERELSSVLTSRRGDGRAPLLYLDGGGRRSPGVAEKVERTSSATSSPAAVLRDEEELQSKDQLPEFGLSLTERSLYHELELRMFDTQYLHCVHSICFLPANYNLFVTHPWIKQLFGQENVRRDVRFVHWVGSPKPWELPPGQRSRLEEVWWGLHAFLCEFRLAREWSWRHDPVADHADYVGAGLCSIRCGAAGGRDGWG